jgi:hypothetical protein
MINHEGAKMKYLLTGILGSFLLVSAGCSTVGGVWEAGKTIVTGTVDAVVGGTTEIVTSVAEDVADTTDFVLDTTAGVVEDVADRIDEETDELQEESPKE